MLTLYSKRPWTRQIFSICYRTRCLSIPPPRRGKTEFDGDLQGAKSGELKSPSEKYGTYQYKHESWFNIPNSITLTRMVASPALAYFILYDMKGLALGGCMLAAFTDWLDGYIAKNHNQSTVLGGMIDPVADKLVIGSLTAGLAMKGLMPAELAILIIGRDVALFGGSMALRAMEKPTDSPFFDTTYSATFEIIPSTLSKINTVNQFLLITVTLSHWMVDVPASIETIVPLWYITGATTLGSLLGYLDGSAVKRLSDSGVSRGSAPSEGGEGERRE
jgi:cardiolipin synthase